MKTTRRTFVRTLAGSTIGAISLAASNSAFGHSVEGYFSRSAANFLSRSSFDPFVNSAFTMRDAGGRSFRAKLVEVLDLTRDRNAKNGYVGESFSLIFVADSKARMEGGMYKFTHETLGNFELFLVPVGLGGTRYEAVINRISGSF